jgi:SAM-dependent methyltransferase
VGCGRGSHAEDSVDIRRQLRVLKGKVARVIGIDPDPSAITNSIIDEFRLIEADEWPVNAKSVDLIVCDNVLEHLKTTEPFFSEARRVLKPNGYLCLRTPNKWSYIATLARLIPNDLHQTVLARVQEGRRDAEVFPTFYQCNTQAKLRRMLTRYKFDSVVYGYESEPRYLSFSRSCYWLGVLHQRFAPAFLRSVLLAFAQRQE